MPTVIIDAADVNACAAALDDAARALRAGQLVVFPTETVYGVAASAAHPEAVTRLRTAKGRASDQPFTVHLGARRQAARYLTQPSPLVRRLVRKAWPGPLTLVCDEAAPEQTKIASVCPAPQLRELYRNGTVGLRCPDHPATARLLGSADVPIVASSANRHGEPPPLDLQEALRHFDGLASHAIDGGRTRFSSASTIVAVRGAAWTILRTGALDARTLERLAWSVVLFVCTGNSCRSPMAQYLFQHGLAQRLGCPVAALASMGYRVLSAGSAAVAGGNASSGAIEELARRGIDLRDHRSQPLTQELLHRSERIFVMSPGHERAVLDLVPAAAAKLSLLDAGGPVADPFGGTDEEYRTCAHQIEHAVNARLQEFLDEDRDWE